MDNKGDISKRMQMNLLNFLELINAMIVTIIVIFIILFFVFNGQFTAIFLFIVSLAGSYGVLYLINKYYGSSEKYIQMNGYKLSADGNVRNPKCGVFDNIVFHPFHVENSFPDLSLGTIGFIWSYINMPNIMNNSGKLTEIFSSEVIGVITIMTIVVLFAASGKVLNKCISITNAMISILCGTVLGTICVILITMGDSEEYLFNAYSSRKAICGRANKRFRCKKEPKDRNILV
tara:strand:- start:2197 stop:2895 length:699 start_codon:yes stop_codon:yes gene_type:complete